MKMHLALEVKSLDLQIMNKRPENYEKENDSKDKLQDKQLMFKEQKMRFCKIQER